MKSRLGTGYAGIFYGCDYDRYSNLNTGPESASAVKSALLKIPNAENFWRGMPGQGIDKPYQIGQLDFEFRRDIKRVSHCAEQVGASLLFVYMIEELDLLVEFYLWLFSVVWSLWSLWVN